ncbi:MAG TPA: glycoside hydrolase family 76 protein [Solirubrobacteraceae bacterium]|nr:glycoside hydrolase family 76 protein [Solirubrobacteraceae bacterium]
MTGPLAGACLLAVIPCASAPPAGAAHASPYPAAASHPPRVARAREFARQASSSANIAGGAAGPAGGAGSPSTKTPSTKTPSRKPKAKPKPTLRGNPARALLAFEAMQKAYYIRGSGLYQGEPFSYLWPFSQALAATVTMSHVTGVQKVPGLSAKLARELNARLVGLHSYLDTDNSGASEGTFTSQLAAFDGTVAPPTGPGGTKYYDDNEWVAIELLRIYELTHNSDALGSAEAIMAFVMAGWDTEPELACPGGIPFSNSSENTERNTVTDGPAAELAVKLYQLTANPQYLTFAQTAYEWVRACLLGPNGLYADHIGAQGKVAQTYWSYNQGSMIGAGVLLYQATHNAAYLYQARQAARAGLAYFTPERLAQEIPFFPSVYFRNLLYLDSVTHDPPGPSLPQAYVNYAWQHLRLSSGLFVYGSPPASQLLVQAAIVQVYALLASPPATYF